MIRKVTGETLVEVMVAITIMGVVLTAAFVLFDQAISTNINIRSRVAAMSIAQDAVEGLRNIRDTNWMQFSGARRDKWYYYYDKNAATHLPMDTGFYSIEFDEGTQQYVLAEGDSKKALFGFNCDLEGAGEYNYVSARFLGDDCPLGTVNTDPALKNDYKLLRNYPDPAKLGYSYAHTAGANPKDSLFYRQLYIQLMSPFDADLDPSSQTTAESKFCSEPHCKKAALKVHVLVYWYEGDEHNKLLLETYLFDYYQRDKYQNY